MKSTVSSFALAIALMAAAEWKPAEAPQDSRGYVDALGRVTVTSIQPRGGVLLEGPGNPGFWLDIRNWDPERSVRSITAMAGFSPREQCRVTAVKTFKVSADGEHTRRGPGGEVSVNQSGVITIADVALGPAE